MKDGSETSSWLNANTKPCPKCSKPVEKNGGWVAGWVAGWLGGWVAGVAVVDEGPFFLVLLQGTR